MTALGVRTIVVEALECASVISLRDKNLTEGFLDGRGDVPLAALDIDSLAVMELCIAIEAHTGVEIVPDDLPRIGTLDRLVQAILERRR